MSVEVVEMKKSKMSLVLTILIVLALSQSALAAPAKAETGWNPLASVAQSVMAAFDSVWEAVGDLMGSALSESDEEYNEPGSPKGDGSTQEINGQTQPFG